MKEYIHYITNIRSDDLIAWSDKPKLLYNYIKLSRQENYSILSISKKKFYKTYTNIEEKELIVISNTIITKEDGEYLEKVIDNENYLLADTIEYLKTLSEKYDISDKEIKKINKANSILMELFNNFNDYYNTDINTISSELINEFKRQDCHIKDIL